MTAYGTEFFTFDEVNRLKITQDVVDRRLTTHMASAIGNVDACLSVTTLTVRWE